jgi:outer membrane protein assembly factor BamB
MRNRAITAAAAALFSTASCTDGPTQSVAADSIRVAWRTPLNTGTGGTPGLQGIAADAERLYVITRGVAAYDLRTGEQRWHTPNAPAAEPGNGRAPVNVVTRDGRVFTSGHVARALVAATGAELWTFTPDTAAVAMTTVDERAFYIGTESRRVYSLDVATGKPRWSAEVLPRGPYRAVVTGIVLHGDTLYVSLVEETSPTGHLKRGWIVAVERHEGRVLWRYVNERQGEAHDAGRHAVAGRIVLVNDLNGGAFLGIDRFTGKEVWRHVGPAGLFGAWDEFKVADGIAYVASNDTRVYAFDPETGRIHWTHRLKGSANSSAVCGEHIFAAAGSLHMLSRADGKQKSVLFQDREGFVQPDAFVVSRLLAHGNRVYFVGHNAVYAVECSP